jgi:Asp-tRNA(Asn)/Glu-tRNA(Gln) amidotransferase A subunit family amidase
LTVAQGNPSSLTAIEAAERIAGGDISAEEMTGACLEHIAAVDDKVHAFIHLDPGEALQQARRLDERRRNGNAIGPLHGVPVAIKDIFDTADYKTECGSPILKGRQPMRDCTAVARLREAGAVIIGKTVTTEFAYMHPGATRNPHDLARTPGGSSSGSAAAVAAGMVPLAIGSQTNGSVIRPSAFCGVYGCKPTHGTISRHGVLQLSQALDHVGVFARSLPDTALILEVLAGYDANDGDTRPVAAPSFLEMTGAEPPLPPRFAFVQTPVWDKAEAETRAAFEGLVDRLGEQAQLIKLGESFAAAWDDHRTIMAADMAHNLRATVVRGDEAASSRQLRDFLAEGEKVTAVRYLAARDAARRYAAAVGEIFKDYDAIITPAAPGVAPKGEATGNPVFCSLWTLTGLPALSLPLLKGEGGMPLGVQLIGDRGDDARLLRTANWLIAELAED